MMETLRKNMKIILWVVVVAFLATIFFVWGKGGGLSKDKIVAEVNGDKITYEDFFQIWYKERQQWQNMLKSGFTPQFAEQRKFELLQKLVLIKLVVQEAKKMDITAGDDELVDRIKKVHFSENGFVNEERFKEAAKNPSVPWKDIEKQESTNIQVEKVQKIISDGAKLTADDIKKQYMQENGNRNVEYMFFTYKLSGSEKQVVYDKAKKVLAEAKSGKDFNLLVSEYSEDPQTKNSGGDLGSIERKNLKAEFRDGIANIRPGEIGGPVKTEYGYHIIKLGSDVVEDKIHIYHILLKAEANDEKKAKIKEQVSTAVQQIRTDEKFEKIAGQYGGARTTGFFSKESKKINNVETVDQFITKAYETPLNTINVLETKEGIYILKVTGKTSPTEAEFNKEKAVYLSKAIRDKGFIIFNTWLGSVQSRSKIGNVNLPKED